jgi:hypothetical protein
MGIFITDKENSYKQNKSEYKFLFQGWMIQKWNLTDSTDKFNLSLNGIEFIAADAMLEELSTALDKLENEKLEYNKFMATRINKRDIHFSLLYKSYWSLVIKKHVLRIVLEKFLQKIKNQNLLVTLALSSDFRLASIDFSNHFPSCKFNYNFYSKQHSYLDQIKPWFKNIAYFAFQSVKKLSSYNLTKPKGKTNVLLVVYDIQSFEIVLENFYKLVETNSKIHLTIVVQSSGIANEKSVDLKKREGPNISVYDYSLFRCANFIKHTKLYSLLESWHPSFAEIKNQGIIENLENHYAWMGNVFEQVKANVCLTIGIASETGRAISDAARYYNVPCVNLEYGINTDDPLYCSYNTKFTARACVGQSNIDIWKKRKDPSEKHIPIGFCKLDGLKYFVPDAKSFYLKHNLNPNNATLFFASSWTAGNKSYDIEKQVWVNDLALLCNEKNWNLLIKKHPAETDDFVETILKKYNFKNQLVFNHTEIGLHEAISYCTVATTQSSSMFAETLYFDKPFCFITKAKQGGITELYTSIKEDGLFETYQTTEELASFVEKNLNPAEIEKFKIKAAKLKEKYLFRTDGLASQRLLDLLLELSH